MSSPFNEAKYKALLEGLEAVELNSNEFGKDNFEFRLDSEYFLKSNLAYLKRLEKVGFNTIGEFSYVTDGIHTSIDYSESSKINLISATSPRENYFDLSRNAFISEIEHLNNPRTALKENDIIISTVGTIGNCAVVTKSILPANSDRHVGIIRIKGRFLPNYVSTFLLTKFGRFQSWRESTGNVQLNLFLYRIRTLKIANLSYSFQEIIDDKIKLAHSKIEQSKQKYSDAERFLLESLGLENFQPCDDSVNIKSFKESFLTTGRLDAEHYQKKYEEIESRIKKFKLGFTYTSNEFVLSKEVIDRANDFYNYTEIGDVNVSDGSVFYTKVGLEDLPANGKMVLKAGQIIISKVRPYRGAVGIIRDCPINYVGSGAFTILNENGKYKKEVLQTLLRSAPYQTLIMKYNVGSSYPVVKDEDILNLPIPLISDQNQIKIADLVEESFRLKKQSENFLETAKRAVEIAIEENEVEALKFIENESIKYYQR